jgi:hypothetical protein
MPAAEPPANLKRSRRPSFIRSSLVAVQAAVFEAAGAVALHAVVHLHARPSMKRDARHRCAPDVLAVPADAVALVRAQVVRLRVRPVALRAGELGQLDVRRVREVDVFRLLRIDLPRDVFVNRIWPTLILRFGPPARPTILGALLPLLFSVAPAEAEPCAAAFAAR